MSAEGPGRSDARAVDPRACWRSRSTRAAREGRDDGPDGARRERRAGSIASGRCRRPGLADRSPASAATERTVTTTIVDPQHDADERRRPASRLSPRRLEPRRAGRKVAARVMRDHDRSDDARHLRGEPDDEDEQAERRRAAASSTAPAGRARSGRRRPRSTSSATSRLTRGPRCTGSTVAATTRRSVGTATIIPRMPPSVAPIGRAMSTTAGWRVDGRPKTEVARTLPRTTYIAPRSGRTGSAPSRSPPAPYAASSTIDGRHEARRRTGRSPRTRTMTASGPASGTPRSVRNDERRPRALMAAVIAVPRRYPPADRIASTPAVSRAARVATRQILPTPTRPGLVAVAAGSRTSGTGRASRSSRCVATDAGDRRWPGPTATRSTWSTTGRRPSAASLPLGSDARSGLQGGDPGRSAVGQRGDDVARAPRRPARGRRRRSRAGPR